MAQQHHSSPTSSRLPRAFIQPEELEASNRASQRVQSSRPIFSESDTTSGRAIPQVPKRRVSQTDVNGDVNRGPTAAPRRQPRAEDDVHFTSRLFTARTDSSRPGTPIDAKDKRGIVSRATGTALLGGSAIVALAAVVLTAFLQVYISVPLFLVAGALFYVGRKSVSKSATEATEEPSADPQRRREPDVDD
jgi:hypothetical protein